MVEYKKNMILMRCN